MNNIVEVGKSVVFEGKNYTVLQLHKGIGTSEVKAILRGENGQTMEVLKRILEADTSMNKKAEKVVSPVVEEKIEKINNDIYTNTELEIKEEKEEELQNNNFFNKNINKSTRKNKK